MTGAPRTPSSDAGADPSRSARGQDAPRQDAPPQQALSHEALSHEASRQEALSREAFAFLLGLAADGVAIETHISRVALVGARAYKLKKPVAFPYLDFSTRAKRQAAAMQELALNQPHAPSLYRGVRAITREADGRLALDGAGEPIEPVLEMARFDQADLFDAMAQSGRLTPAILTRLTATIAAQHRDAPPVFARTAMGFRRTVEGALAGLAGAALAPAAVEAYGASVRAAFADHAPLLDARGRAGKIRHCHGDLTLRNICLFDGAPTPFDRLEFDAALATIDVLYDLAFLLMDLIHRGRPDLANLVFNRYLDEADELNGAPALPLFMSVRAAIRAQVCLAQAAARACDDPSAFDPADRDAPMTEAHAYFDLARRLIAPRPIALVAIGGFSGSGKSTLAAALAPALGPAPGARILSSDRLRKTLFGKAADEPLPETAYAPAVSEQVYAQIAERAERALWAQTAVVADAVFDQPHRAAAIADVARSVGAPFIGLWLAAPRTTLAARIAARRDDPSDATVAVLEAQLAHGTPAPWPHIPAEGVATDMFAAAPPALRDLLKGGDAT